jgi:hypothetical protein
LFPKGKGGVRAERALGFSEEKEKREEGKTIREFWLSQDYFCFNKSHSFPFCPLFNLKRVKIPFSFIPSSEKDILSSSLSKRI